MRNVLFVCTGNVCRSPMAAGLFNAKAMRAGDGDKLVATSAGTWALENEPASTNAVTIMAERGIDLSGHRGRMVSSSELANAAVVIVMTTSHRDALAAEFPEARSKIHLMSELKDHLYDIADPYGDELPEYVKCANDLEQLIEIGYAKLVSWTSSSVG